MTDTFSNLTITTSYPVSWHIGQASPLVDSMTALYREILADGSRGTAYFSAPGDPSNGVSWLGGDDALGALDLVTQQWIAACEARDERVFDLVTRLDSTESGATVAFDGLRLTAVLERLQGPESVRHLESMDLANVALSLKSAWTLIGGLSDHLDQRLIWTPRLVISEGPMQAQQWCPVEIDVEMEQREHSADNCAFVLEHLLWRACESAFDDLRRLTGLRSAIFVLSDQAVRAPVFYYAVPGGAANISPAELLRSGWKNAVRAIAQETLGTSQIMSGRVSHGCIDDRFCALRAAIDSQTYYLVFECQPEDDFAESLSAFVDVADDFSRVEAMAAGLASQLSLQHEDLLPMLRTWASTAFRTQQLEARIAGDLGLRQLRAAERERYTIALEQLRLGFQRFVRSIRPTIIEISEAGAEFERQLEGQVFLTSQFHGFAPAGAGESRPIERFDQLYPLVQSRRSVAQLTQMSSSLLDSIEEGSRFWEATIASQRAAAAATQQRQDRLVGAGLALVAVIGSLPFLIGSASWNDLQQEMESWPPIASWLGRVIVSMHGPLVVMTILLAIGLVLFVAGALLFRAASRVRPTSPFIGAIAQHCLNARMASAMTEECLDADDVEAADHADQRCLGHLLAAASALLTLRSQAASAHDAITETRLLLGQMELFDLRPRILWGPRQAAFYFVVAPHLSSGPAVSESDVDAALGLSGYSIEGAEALLTMLKDESGSLDGALLAVRNIRPAHTSAGTHAAGNP